MAKDRETPVLSVFLLWHLFKVSHKTSLGGRGGVKTGKGSSDVEKDVATNART